VEAPHRLVVGLGNPGSRYAQTRHNVGFMVVELLARRWELDGWRTKHDARILADPRRRVILVQPQSYMNLSGGPVRALAAWYRTPPDQILVLADDMDLPFGKLRMRPHGGHGGHNGLRSIIAAIGDRFPRVRIGIGRPARDGIEHVLSPFDDGERTLLPAVLDAAADGVTRWLDDGIERAMQFVNVWSPPLDAPTG
jgi:PTH1 family peptidyl-tRNA hydrolase